MEWSITMLLHNHDYMLIKLMPRGFSLIEILTAVSIMGLIAFIAVPSINRFSSDQTLKNTANELVAYIQTVQNNSRNKVVCSTSNSSKIWWLMFKDSTTYQITASCADSSFNSYPQNRLPSDTTLSVCNNDFSNANISWENQSGEVKLRCGVFIDTDFIITLANTKTSATKQIIVTKGGVIKLN